MSGDISRDNWVVPVQGLTRANPDGMARLVACRDGNVTLHLSCAGTQVSVRLNISRAAQLSTGIWEAAGTSQNSPDTSATTGLHHPSYPPEPENRPIAW
ncbi:MAG: hypothetical protein ACRDTA_30365 [Pseudonocardiaceae bacterium]